MDPLDKLAAAANAEIENVYFYLGKLEESMGRISRITDNVRKKAEAMKEVNQMGVPPKQKPPACTANACGPSAASQSVRLGAERNSQGKAKDKAEPLADNKARNKTWHEKLSPPEMARRIIDESAYVIPRKSIRYKVFEDGDGNFFMEFQISAEHHHSATTYVAVEEFSIPIVDTLDKQVFLFDSHIGSLMTVKFQPKGYADDDRDWSNL